MRLIDADKLPIWSFPISWEEGVGIEKCCEAVKNAPTVEAIPIEWIIKWACEFINPNSEGYKMAMELVHDWEKENE